MNSTCRQFPTIAFSLLAIWLSLNSRWLWNNWYHGILAPIDIIFSLLISGSILVFLAIIFFRFSQFGGNFCYFIILSSFIFLLYRVIRPVFGFESTPLSVQALIFFIIIVLSSFIISKHKKRLYLFFGVFSLIFLISGMIFGRFSLENKIAVLGLERFDPGLQEIPYEKIFFILDELSPEMLPLIEANFRSENLKIVSSNVPASGKNTEESIPGMLLGQQLIGTMPCGPFTLCAHDMAIDFSKFYVMRDNVDVVGFHHPYCHIGGLRSCFEPKNKKGELVALHSLMCSFPLYRELKSCLTDFDLMRGAVGKLRSEMKEAIFNRPFWSRGGTLFIHLPLPHPPADMFHGSLKLEYKKNVDEAIDILKRIIGESKKSFGDRFYLIVTSDHALRSSFWCELSVYSDGACIIDNPPNKNIVPLLVSSPTKLGIRLPKTNLGILR